MADRQANQHLKISRRELTSVLFSRDFTCFFRRVICELYPQHANSWSDFMEVMCVAGQQVIDGTTKRLLVNIPPRHLKSTCISVALVAFYLGRWPHRQVLVASYGEDLGVQHTEQFRRIVNSPWYRQLFPKMRIKKGHNRADDIGTTMGGFRKAVTPGGLGTGIGADLIIIDDLVKAADAASDTMQQRSIRYYEETLVSRINDKSDVKIIAIQQRLHEYDLSAFLLEKGNYTHLCLPAIATQEEEHALSRGDTFRRSRGELLWPEHMTRKDLDEARIDMSDYAFQSQYQQEPVPRHSPIVDFEAIPRVKVLPRREECEHLVISIDPAFSPETMNAPSAATIWGHRDKIWTLLDLQRVHKGFPEMLRFVEFLRKQWSPDKIVIESDGAGTGFVQQLKEGDYRHIYSGFPTRGKPKEERLLIQADRLTNGQFVFPETAPWLRDLRQEWRSFPNGRYKDQVDSISQFVAWVHSPRGRGMVNRDPITGRPVRQRRDIVRRR